MMRYIQSDPCPNTKTIVTTSTSSSPDIALPRPTTLSSFLSSLSCQSYGSIGSCTSLLFRNTSSSTRINDSCTDYLYYDSKNLFLGTDVASVLPSIHRAWNSSDDILQQPSSASLSLTPADGDCDLHSHIDHCGMTRSNSNISTCSSTIHAMEADKIESEPSKKPYRASDLHKQSRRQWYSKADNSENEKNTTMTTTPTGSNTTTVTIIPTKIPKSYDVKLEMSRKRKEANNVAATPAPRTVKKQKVKTIPSSSCSTKSTRKIKIEPKKAPNSTTDATTAIARKRKGREKSDKGDNVLSKRRKRGRPPKVKSEGTIASCTGSSDDTVEETLSNDANQAECSFESLLDDWQQQFLNFITYPSDHVLTTNGTKVSLRDTIVWGRQKVLWTTPFMKSNDESPFLPRNSVVQEPLEVQSNVLDTNDNCSNTKQSKRSKRGMIPAKAGGNHLSQQLVVQAALAAAQQHQELTEDGDNDDSIKTATFSNCTSSDVFTFASSSLWSDVGVGGQRCISDDDLFAVDDFTDFVSNTNVPKYPKKTPRHNASKVLMIRRNKEQALWFHGGTSMNQDMGEWLQKERESYHEHRSESLEKKQLHSMKIRRERSKRGKTNFTRISLSKSEMDERYSRIQRSFQYRLLELSGMDIQTIRHDATMFYGTYVKE
jgi:hypothetical protein